MYIFGGYNGNTKNHLNSLYRYSIKENLWECITSPGNIPCKRRRQACIQHEDKVYLFGGTRYICIYFFFFSVGKKSNPHKVTFELLMFEFYYYTKSYLQ